MSLLPICMTPEVSNNDSRDEYTHHALGEYNREDHHSLTCVLSSIRFTTQALDSPKTVWIWRFTPHGTINNGIQPFRVRNTYNKSRGDEIIMGGVKVHACCISVEEEKKQW